jgi:hypothetical protein
MNARATARKFWIVMFVCGLVVYVAAKIHFFRHYGETGYARDHSIYWILIAAIALVVLIVEKILPEKPRE